MRGSGPVPSPSYPWPFILLGLLPIGLCGRKQAVPTQLSNLRNLHSSPSLSCICISSRIKTQCIHHEVEQIDHTTCDNYRDTLGEIFSREFLSAGQKPCPVKACCVSQSHHSCVFSKLRNAHLHKPLNFLVLLNICVKRFYSMHQFLQKKKQKQKNSCH